MALPGSGPGLTLAHRWGFSYGSHCDTVFWPCLAQACLAQSSIRFSCATASVALLGPGSCLAQGLGTSWPTTWASSYGIHCDTASHMASTVTKLLWPCLAQGLGSRWSATGGFSYGFYCGTASLALPGPGPGGILGN